MTLIVTKTRVEIRKHYLDLQHPPCPRRSRYRKNKMDRVVWGKKVSLGSQLHSKVLLLKKNSNSSSICLIKDCKKWILQKKKALIITQVSRDKEEPLFSNVFTSNLTLSKSTSSRLKSWRCWVNWKIAHSNLKLVRPAYSLRVNIKIQSLQFILKLQAHWLNIMSWMRANKLLMPLWSSNKERSFTIDWAKPKLKQKIVSSSTKLKWKKNLDNVLLNRT